MFSMTSVFGDFFIETTTLSQMFYAKNHLLFQGYKNSEGIMHVALVIPSLPEEHLKNGTNGLFLTAFDGVNLQITRLRSFCIK